MDRLKYQKSYKFILLILLANLVPFKLMEFMVVMEFEYHLAKWLEVLKFIITQGSKI